MELIELAIVTARDCHAKQSYYGGSYFDRHLAKVATIVCDHTNDPNVIAAAYLHDLVEDTDKTIRFVRDQFNNHVADLVWRLTDEPGKNRAERHLNTYWKIRASNDAVLIKLADRIVNMQTSRENNRFFSMYKKEYPLFRAALFTPGIHGQLWAILNDLFEVS